MTRTPTVTRNEGFTKSKILLRVRRARLRSASLRSVPLAPLRSAPFHSLRSAPFHSLRFASFARSATFRSLAPLRFVRSLRSAPLRQPRGHWSSNDFIQNHAKHIVVSFKRFLHLLNRLVCVSTARKVIGVYFTNHAVIQQSCGQIKSMIVVVHGNVIRVRLRNQIASIEKFLESVGIRRRRKVFGNKILNLLLGQSLVFPMDRRWRGLVHRSRPTAHRHQHVRRPLVHF